MRLAWNKILASVFFSILLLNTYGQYDPFIDLNMFNHMYYNMGYAGDGNEIEAKIVHSSQWISFDKSPNTTFISIDAPFKLFNQHHGVGLSISKDLIGYFSNTGVNLAYAYRRKLIQGDLGIGVGLNVTNFELKGTWVTPETDAKSDYAIPKISEATPWLFDLNIGLFYRADNLYLGLSSRNLTNSKVEFVKEERNVESYIGRQIYLSTGYDYQLANPLFSFEPAIALATDFSSMSFSATGILKYNKRIFGGIGYKYYYGPNLIFGIDLPSGIEVAVSYAYPSSRINQVSWGSFEFMAGYSFSLDMDKDNRKYKSVRFL